MMMVLLFMVMVVNVQAGFYDCYVECYDCHCKSLKRTSLGECAACFADCNKQSNSTTVRNIGFHNAYKIIFFLR